MKQVRAMQSRQSKARLTSNTTSRQMATKTKVPHAPMEWVPVQRQNKAIRYNDKSKIKSNKFNTQLEDE